MVLWLGGKLIYSFCESEACTSTEGMECLVYGGTGPKFCRLHRG